jgi:Beta-ketoacyl synthase, N-terminal domain
MPEFMLRQWCAWAPALHCIDDRLIEPSNVNLPKRVPKMLQRRLTPLARAVFNVTEPCLELDKSLPVVFCSAHGEICKSLAMLNTIQAGEDLSPTAFSLSVHNAIAGLFSIAYGNNQEITVLAPGQEGIAPAFIEALGLLQEGAEEVLVILYDEPISAFYPTAPFKLNTELPCALALKVALCGNGQAMQFNHAIPTRDDGEHPVQLLTFVRFLLSEQPLLRLGNQGHSWVWHKH